MSDSEPRATGAGPASTSDELGGGGFDSPPPAGKSVVSDGSSRGRRKLSGLGVSFIMAGVIILGLRIWLVQAGILYGSSPVTQVDVAVGALLVIGVACISLKRQKSREASALEGATSGEGGWTNWASGATALAGAGALVVSLLNIVQPLSPPGLATRACPGARVKSVPYIGITAVADGVNSRQGPARSYLPDGRYPGGCSLGFSAYCLGDQIGDTGGTSTEVWVTSRWLLIAKQTSKYAKKAAQFLSGEKRAPQFISDAFVYPETSYSSLRQGDPKQCPGGYPYPAKATLQPFDARADIFTATAHYAANMGFAVWVPPQQGFLNGNSYLQLSSLSLQPSENPGQTTSSGTKAVRWDYTDTLITELQSPAASDGRSTGNVVIMAIPCLAPNIPARTGTAAISGYRLSARKPPLATSNVPQGLDLNRLARAACEAAT